MKCYVVIDHTLVRKGTGYPNKMPRQSINISGKAYWVIICAIKILTDHPITAAATYKTKPPYSSSDG